MAAETCSHNSHAPVLILARLHESQAGKHRHKCCVCAYQEGFRLGSNQTKLPLGNVQKCREKNAVAISILSKIPHSQAGEGRHKCAVCAFNFGFDAGSKAKHGTVNQTAAGFGDESKLYQRRARQALPLLVAHAKAKTTVTYGQFSREMKMLNPRNLNWVLGALGSELKILEKKWNEKIPPLNCLVLNKYDGTPQHGIEFYMPLEEFENLTPAKKKLTVQLVMSDIWEFQKWDEVLRNFGLEPIIPSDSTVLQELAKEIRYGRGGGESEEHRRLKEYVKGNPGAVGLGKPIFGKTEYCFHSMDEIDVLFCFASAWVGIEVKGKDSDDADIMRGIFQCIKYQALIEATQRYEQAKVNGRVLLALGGKLSHELRQLTGILHIDVVEGIQIPDTFSSG
jgi:hypothetical protein